MQPLFATAEDGSDDDSNDSIDEEWLHPLCEYILRLYYLNILTFFITSDSLDYFSSLLLFLCTMHILIWACTKISYNKHLKSTHQLSMKLCEKNLPITDFNLPITRLRPTKKLCYRKRGYRRYITTKRQDKYTKIGNIMPCTYKFHQSQTTNFEVSYVEHYPIRDMHLGSILVHSS